VVKVGVRGLRRNLAKAMVMFGETSCSLLRRCNRQQQRLLWRSEDVGNYTSLAMRKAGQGCQVLEAVQARLML